MTNESATPYLKDIFELYQDKKVYEFYPDGPLSKDQAQDELNFFIKEFREKNIPCFLILNKQNKNFMGVCGFSGFSGNSIDVGYMLFENYWHQGFATECLVTLLKWGVKNIQASRIIAYTPSDHLASISVMKKSGMIYYETKISPIYNVICDYYIYFIDN